MKVDILDLKKAKVGELELDDAIFATEVREHLFWEVINWQRAKRRAGTHKVKGRSEVSGGGKKPFKQKGTGRARQGSTRASNMVGGGKVHGPSPRDYSFRMPKKKRKAAMCSALSLKAQNNALFVVDSLSFDRIKTRDAAAVLATFEAPKALFVDVTHRDGDTKPQHNVNLRLSVRNLKNAKYLAVEGLNIEDLLAHQALIISREAVEHVQEALKA